MGFTLIQNRRRRRLNTQIASSSHGLQGAPPPICDIFVSRVERGDEQTINAFLAKNNVRVFENVRVSHLDATYSSFKISIPVFDKSKVLRKRFWPSGIQCKVWREPRNYESDSDDSIYSNDGRPYGSTFM